MTGHPLVQAKNFALIWVSDAEARSRNFFDYHDASRMSERLAEAVGEALVVIDPCADDRPFILDDQLTAPIAEAGKRSLILCGGRLEGAVTQVAIATLLEGYDVFVCADLSFSDDEKHRALFLDRLASLGASIVTWGQLVLELLAQEADSDARARLHALIAE